MSTPIAQLRQDEDNSSTVNNILNQLEQDNQSGGSQQPHPQMQQPQQQQYMEQPNQMEPYEDYDGYYDGTEEVSMSMTDKIISELKMPLVVVLLVFLTNYGMVNELLIKNLPKLSNGNELNILGLGVKAVLAGLVFYLVRKFL